jgi:flagellar hook protein FlgE
VNPDGLQVQGYAIDTAGNLSSISDIYIPGERISPPVATTEFNFDINLSSAAGTGDTYTTAQTMYDTLGNAIPVTFTFTRQAAAQTWTVTGTIPSSAGTGVTFGGNPSMDVVFDSQGAMTSPAGNVTLALALTNGAAPLSTTWALQDASGNSYGDLTGYASESATTFQYQDGYPAGSLRSISVDEAGIVTATYSNGELTPMFQIALADFPSYDGLTKMGRNLYAESVASGQALPGVAGTGRLGSVAPSSLEMSNVDLAEEFVKMITTQRAFQANSRVITASDEILTELINIKR